MNKNNSSVYGIIAVVSLLAAMLTSCIWSSHLSGTGDAWGYMSLLLGGVFTFAISRCITMIEGRQTNERTAVKRNESYSIQ